MLPLLSLLVACHPDGGDDTGPGVQMVDEAYPDCADYNPGTGVSAGDDLWRVVLDDPAAVCNDGTPGIMYIRPAAAEEYADQWVFYLQGGGACADFESCETRWCGTAKYTKAKMSTAWTVESAAENALFTRDGVNPFGQANQVMLYYCSSDQWMGTRADTVLEDPLDPSGDYRLHFRGHEIVRAAVERLLDGPVAADANGDVTVPSLAEADRVVWAGSSAGGGGAERHADWLTDLLAPNGTEVVAWFDANLPIAYEDMGEVGPLFEESDRDMRWPEVYVGRYGIFLDASCEQMHPGADKWLCGNGEHLVLNHITTPFFARQDLSDTVIGERYLANGVTVPAMATAWALTVDRVFEIPSTAEEASSITRGPGMYAPNCGQHVGLNDDAWFTGAIVRDDDPGTTEYTHRSAFLAWYAGADVEVLDGQPRSASTCPQTDDDGG